MKNDEKKIFHLMKSSLELSPRKEFIKESKTNLLLHARKINKKKKFKKASLGIVGTVSTFSLIVWLFFFQGDIVVVNTINSAKNFLNNKNEEIIPPPSNIDKDYMDNEDSTKTINDDQTENNEQWSPDAPKVEDNNEQITDTNIEQNIENEESKNNEQHIENEESIKVENKKEESKINDKVFISTMQNFYNTLQKIYDDPDYNISFKFRSYDTKEEIYNEFNNIATQDFITGNLNNKFIYLEVKEDGLYNIPTETPPKFLESYPYKLTKTSDTTYELSQSYELKDIPIKVDILITFEKVNGQFLISKISYK
nr:hypothetical protein [Fredinandcohnia onubensis]